MLRLIWEKCQSVQQSHNVGNLLRYKVVQTWHRNIKVGLTSTFLIGLSRNHCCIATNHEFSSKKGNQTFSVQDSCLFKAPSKYAFILALWPGLRQRPMARSVSWTRLRKRSRSRAISSQGPLRDACRANGHVLITWTWTTGENCTWSGRKKTPLKTILIEDKSCFITSYWSQ